MKQRRLIVAAIMLLTLTVLGVTAFACSDNGDNGEGASGGSAIVETRFEASEFAYDMPPSIEGGLVRLTMSNTGREPHQANLLRLNDGVTDDQLQAALMNPDPGAIFAIGVFRGGPNTNAPGATDSVVTEVDAGKYALLCFVASEDGVSHIARGMVDVFDVTAPPAAAADEPEAEETYQLADFAVLGADNLPAGETTVRIENRGPQVHEFTVIKLEGITFDEARRLVEGTGPEPAQGGGAAEVIDSGGLGAIENGRTAWAQLNLEQGTYAFLCFIPDRSTGRDHASLGMMKEVTVE